MTPLEALLNQVAPTISRLYGRWLDERQYEDINEYYEVLKKELPKWAVPLGMSKRPFGIRFKIIGNAVGEYLLSCTTKHVTVKRVA